MRKTWGIIFTALIITTLIAFPVSAVIQESVATKYDATGATPDFGEEIFTTVQVSPGDAEVKDLIIDFREADAFIDDNSFVKSIDPAGASVNISRVGNVFSVDKLLPGQMIIITFRAYPKTLQQQELHVADVGFSYTQRGDRIQPPPLKSIKADLSSSSWFLLQNAQSEYNVFRETTKNQTDQTMMIFYGSVILIVVAGAIIFLYIVKRREYAREYASQKAQKDELIRDLIRKVELAENNKAEFESLKKRLQNELGSDAGSGRSGITEKDQKESNSESKNAGFE